VRHAAFPLGVVWATLMQWRCLNCTTESAGPSQILFQQPARFMRSDSFSLDVRHFDQRGPFLDLALNKFLEIFGRSALGRNQNGAGLLQAYLLEISKVVVRSIMDPIGLGPPRWSVLLLSHDENAND
jgi:hypothetical protein